MVITIRLIVFHKRSDTPGKPVEKRLDVTEPQTGHMVQFYFMRGTSDFPLFSSVVHCSNLDNVRLSILQLGKVIGKKEWGLTPSKSHAPKSRSFHIK